MTDPLSQTFQALADPTRRALLARLSKGEANVNDLAQPFLRDMSLPAITKHIKVLEKAGLIIKSREAQYRPCRIRPEPLRDVENLIEEYRKSWEESLDRLDVYLKSMTSKNKRKGKTNEQKKQVK